MDLHPNPMHEMSLLEQIENDPDVTQASLATRMGVAVGTVNWHLKRLITKGYVKVKRAERRKLRYIITPGRDCFSGEINRRLCGTVISSLPEYPTAGKPLAG